MKIPLIFKPIIKYVTPLLLLIVFLSSLITPLNNDWETALRGEWKLDPTSIIGKIQNKGVIVNRDYFADYFESEVSGEVINIEELPNGKRTVEIAKELSYYRDDNNRIKLFDVQQSAMGELVTFDSVTVLKTYTFKAKQNVLVNEQDQVEVGARLAQGNFINNIFYIDMSRLLLLMLFLFICYLVFSATSIREKTGRMS